MDSEDMHTCGQCQHTFTALEDFARHKYTEHAMRFTLGKCIGKKPQIFYPQLVPLPHNKGAGIKEKKVKEVKLVNRRKRKTFVAQLVEMEGEQQAVINTEHRCNLCSRSFRTEKALLDHKKNTHQVYRCELCPENEQCDINGEEAYDKHTTAHYWKHGCDQCEKRYSTNEGLEYHKKSVHKWVKKLKIDPNDPQKLFPCDQCGKRFIDEKHLQDHMRRMHDWKKKAGFPVVPGEGQQEGISFAVDMPGTNPENPNNQSTDAVTNEEKPEIHLTCYVCEEVIHDVVVFMHHLLGKHITATPHRCGSCDFSTANRGLLTAHMLSEHKKHLPDNPRLNGLIIKDMDSNENSDTTPKQAEEEASEKESVPKAFILIDPKDNKTLTVDHAQDPEKEHEELIRDLIVAASVATGSTESTENTQEEQVQQSGDEKEQLSDADLLKEKELLQALDQLTAVQTVFCGEEPLLVPIPAPADPLDPKKEPLYVCNLCGRSFATKAHLRVHLRKHTGERPFTCDICGRWFITKDSLNKHSVGHSSERRFKCGECGKLFKRMSHVRVHLEHTHSTDKPHVCNLCEKFFKTKQSLRVHNKFSHTEEKPHTCSTCGKTFKTSYSLARHEMVHGERQYKCDDCGRAFSYGSVLAQHKKSKVPCTMKPILPPKSNPATAKKQSPSKDSGPTTSKTKIRPTTSEIQPQTSGMQHTNKASGPTTEETRINPPMLETQSSFPPISGTQHTNIDSRPVTDHVSYNIQQQSRDGHIGMHPASSAMQHPASSSMQHTFQRHSEMPQALMDLSVVRDGVFPGMAHNS